MVHIEKKSTNEPQKFHSSCLKLNIEIHVSTVALFRDAVTIAGDNQGCLKSLFNFVLTADT